jgi:hypothetical protein
MSDGPIDGRLLTITGTSSEPAEMINSLDSGRPAETDQSQ